MSFLSDIGALARDVKAVDREIKQTLGDAATDVITPVTSLKNDVTAIRDGVADTVNGVKTEILTAAKRMLDQPDADGSSDT